MDRYGASSRHYASSDDLPRRTRGGRQTDSLDAYDQTNDRSSRAHPSGRRRNDDGELERIAEAERRKGEALVSEWEHRHRHRQQQHDDMMRAYEPHPRAAARQRGENARRDTYTSSSSSSDEDVSPRGHRRGTATGSRRRAITGGSVSRRDRHDVSGSAADFSDAPRASQGSRRAIMPAPPSFRRGSRMPRDGFEDSDDGMHRGRRGAFDGGRPSGR